MSCTCRTTALRLFVRGLAQLHIAPAGAIHTVPQWQHRALSGIATTVGPRRPLPSRLTRRRALHQSCLHYEVSQTAAVTSTEYEGQQPEEKGGLESAFEDEETSTPDPRSTKRRRYNSLKDPNGTPAVVQSRKKTPKSPSDSVSRETRTGRKSRTKPSPPEKHQTEDDYTPPKREEWQVQKTALQEKFSEGWRPHKRLSPDALDGIRALHQQYPDMFTTEVLAMRFEVSPEAIRRILKSKWRPTADEEERRRERWFSRGKQIWTRWAELGKKPPQKWRSEGVHRDLYRNRPEGRTQSQGKRTRLLGQKQPAEDLA